MRRTTGAQRSDRVPCARVKLIPCIFGTRMSIDGAPRATCTTLERARPDVPGNATAGVSLRNGMYVHERVHSDAPRGRLAGTGGARACMILHDVAQVMVSNPAA